MRVASTGLPVTLNQYNSLATRIDLSERAHQQSWPTANSRQGLKASIIDRLIDPDSDGTSWRPGYSTDQMVDSVRRDLENLLNTHMTEGDLPEEYVETRNSIVAYGIPDLVSNHSAGPMAIERIRLKMEQSIARFEPRLTNVRAKILQPEAGTTHETRV